MTRTLKALTGLPALELEIRTMAFLANSHLESECSDKPMGSRDCGVRYCERSTGGL